MRRRAQFEGAPWNTEPLATPAAPNAETKVYLDWIYQDSALTQKLIQMVYDELPRAKNMESIRFDLIDFLSTILHSTVATNEQPFADLLNSAINNIDWEYIANQFTVSTNALDHLENATNLLEEDPAAESVEPDQPAPKKRKTKKPPATGTPPWETFGPTYTY